ncbi:MAG TPA: hypothetical protein EYP19_15070 [Desulfobacterales bacterium]|nr:hypothetical protein [Desulfobacterales bacterium]
MTESKIAEAIIGGCIVVVGIFAALKRTGLLTLRNTKCPDPECRAQVITTATKVDKIDKNVEKLMKDVEQIGRSVSFVEGKLNNQ